MGFGWSSCLVLQHCLTSFSLFLAMISFVIIILILVVISSQYAKWGKGEQDPDWGLKPAEQERRPSFGDLKVKRKIT